VSSLCQRRSWPSFSIHSPTGPYLGRLEKEQDCEFFFVDGPIVTEPEESIVGFWDQPCYRFFHWPPSPTAFKVQQIYDACDYLNKVIEEHGPFDGVLGFSMGSVMSLATMLRHAQLHPDDRSDALFQFAILFSSPNLPDSDSSGGKATWGKIRVPSLHICGEADEQWFSKSKETFEKHCQGGTARLIIHKGGHTIPKDKPTVDKILEAIDQLFEDADV